jgi:hypothetical protein
MGDFTNLQGKEIGVCTARVLIELQQLGISRYYVEPDADLAVRTQVVGLIAMTGGLFTFIREVTYYYVFCSRAIEYWVAEMHLRDKTHGEIEPIITDGHQYINALKVTTTRGLEFMIDYVYQHYGRERSAPVTYQELTEEGILSRTLYKEEGS